MPNNTTWIDEGIQKLKDVEKHFSLLPQGQFLSPKGLNEVLEAFYKAKNTFILQCNLQGFQTQRTKLN